MELAFSVDLNVTWAFYKLVLVYLTSNFLFPSILHLFYHCLSLLLTCIVKQLVWINQLWINTGHSGGTHATSSSQEGEIDCWGPYWWGGSVCQDWGAQNAFQINIYYLISKPFCQYISWVDEDGFYGTYFMYSWVHLGMQLWAFHVLFCVLKKSPIL